MTHFKHDLPVKTIKSLGKRPADPRRSRPCRTRPPQGLIRALSFFQLLVDIAGDFKGFGDGTALHVVGPGQIYAFRQLLDMQIDDVFDGAASRQLMWFTRTKQNNLEIFGVDSGFFLKTIASHRLYQA